MASDYGAGSALKSVELLIRCRAELGCNSGP